MHLRQNFLCWRGTAIFFCRFALNIEPFFRIRGNISTLDTESLNKHLLFYLQIAVAWFPFCSLLVLEQSKGLTIRFCFFFIFCFFNVVSFWMTHEIRCDNILQCLFLTYCIPSFTLTRDWQYVSKHSQVEVELEKETECTREKWKVGIVRSLEEVGCKWPR